MAVFFWSLACTNPQYNFEVGGAGVSKVLKGCQHEMAVFLKNPVLTSNIESWHGWDQPTHLQIPLPRRLDTGDQVHSCALSHSLECNFLMRGEFDLVWHLIQKWGRNFPHWGQRSSSRKSPRMRIMDKLTGRTSSIAESKKEMSEELPKPLRNLPWKCHMSVALLRSSQRKRTYSRTWLCDGNRIRTKSRKAPKGKAAAGSIAPKKQKTTDVPAPPATSQPTPAPTAHGGKAMEVDALSSTSQPSGAPFPYPFTHTPSQSGAFSVPSHSVPPPVPAPPTRQED